jgi:hypothetical protein
MFYSNTIFSSVGSFSGTQITFYVGLVNFLATFGGLFLLFKLGRRSIMLTCNALMAVNLVMVGYCSLKQADRANEIAAAKEHDPNADDTNSWTFPAVGLVLLFIALFEFSSGPITWLYMAEIMQDKSVSVATVLNWLMNLVISIITPGLVKSIGSDNIGYIFVTVGALTTLGTIFIFFFMLETKGKSPQQIEDMFTSDKEYSKSNMQKRLVQEDYGTV